jgi:hypothetical protein
MDKMITIFIKKKGNLFIYKKKKNNLREYFCIEKFSNYKKKKN